MIFFVFGSLGFIIMVSLIFCIVNYWSTCSEKSQTIIFFISLLIIAIAVNIGGVDLFAKIEKYSKYLITPQYTGTEVLDGGKIIIDKYSNGEQRWTTLYGQYGQNSHVRYYDAEEARKARQEYGEEIAEKNRKTEEIREQKITLIKIKENKLKKEIEKLKKEQEIKQSAYQELYKGFKNFLHTRSEDRYKINLLRTEICDIESKIYSMECELKSFRKVIE